MACYPYLEEYSALSVAQEASAEARNNPGRAGRTGRNYEPAGFRSRGVRGKESA